MQFSICGSPQIQGVKMGSPAAYRLRAVGSVDVREKLSGSRLPLLYLQARNDWLVSSCSLEEIARLRPDVRIESLPGPHCLLQVAPLPAARVIESFMEQHQRK